ncbi:MAG: orotate phosphoribosyltransferase [Hyphomicrobiales bacterium]
MTENEVLQDFRDAGALLEGHFVLTSGLHSPKYLQCARVMMDAQRAGRLCRALRDKVSERIGTEISLVASPAMGGVVVGYEMGRQLGVPAVFFERVDGTLTLRRGFDIEPGTTCLMVEDIVTTGLSSRECIAAIEALGGKVAGACCLIDRSGGKAELSVPLVALAEVEIPTYEEHNIPESLACIPVVKPGSRNLSK